MEVGFLSNYAEGKSLVTKDVQERFVNGVIYGLTGYVNAIR